MAQETNKVFQTAVFINAIGYAGLIEESDIPGPTATMVEHKTITSVGTQNFMVGFDLMEGRLKWVGKSAKVERVAANPFKTHDMQVRSAIERISPTGVRTIGKEVIFLKARFRNAPNSNSAPGALVDSESAIDIDYIRKEIDGVAVYEFDPNAFIYKVEGVDQLADVRNALGLT